MSNHTCDFLELMGRHAEEEGQPRIAGRLLGALLTNPEPSSLDELTEQLQVSKGSVSTNARLLEQVGLAERVTVPGDRRDYYQLTEDFPVRVMENALARIRSLADCMRYGQTQAAAGNPTVQGRFEEFLSFLAHAIEVHEDGLARFRPRVRS